LAEVMWSPKGARNWNGFCDRLERHYKRLDQLGVKYYRDTESRGGRNDAAYETE
jgi:N-acetyl-beta-hexosaminidase